ncbi:MAG: peptide chain release factor N(5)-glutamine methyltransferase [candidate division Zixibacteria bacterium]|nr:peptide chain release factor N(5)-glutamine methyltransferase [candidate division Zixibacteria bacterium]MBU1469644.1 peptide chain release factor N(5)-glutamine methyltransferase [candidate division Zixibacteria bacterium]MBU2626849.1 peptide chain release factor N(5)-glutamine methyltransferase [candidate division Zixibacteria bacterium]
MAEKNIIDLINSASLRLKRIEIDAPRVNVERMLCSILNCNRVDLYLDPVRMLPSDQVAKFEWLFSKRMAFEPLQYILGETEFFGIEIKCDKRALIPRPETEFVVSKAIDTLESLDRLYILDLACGTGCIGIALAINLPQATIHATDISEDAVSLAKENALMHGLITRFSFSAGDMFTPVAGKGVLYDALVCNPPYIRDGEWELLHEQIREFEPRRALLSGTDGLDFIRRMLSEVSEVLVPGGHLIFEMGQGQANSVRQLVDQIDSLEFIETVQDYSAIERVAVVRRRPSSKL